MAGGDSVFVRVAFTPNSLGNNVAVLVMTHNAVGSPTSTALSGTGVFPDIVVSGADSALFAITPSTLTLSRGDIAYVKVTFMPASEGAKTATLTLVHNAWAPCIWP